ncbi:hypothetical protein [Selenomonas ruminantium]|uniref:DNA-damage-inducible protein J n=1 Tax=Selenomonas ruminantium TaxID=971 RepID=A0A1H4AJ44_SELRU|nr:hypothetical protein [Selenomonas ruminantium]SEA35915.1 DNA-damage-inducible protein J [Selenomonas ruminantium]
MASTTTDMSTRMNRVVNEVTAERADSVLIQRTLDADNDHDIHGPFQTVQDAMADLNADD